jgi:hypothetical protein
VAPASFTAENAKFAEKYIWARGGVAFGFSTQKAQKSLSGYVADQPIPFGWILIETYNVCGNQTPKIPLSIP